MHNPVKPCITCHDPHAPEPPRVPQECSACHAEIARTKVLSRHAGLPCTTCHQTEEKHKVNPLQSTPGKPRTREFCGQCHAQEAKSPPEIPRVDLWRVEIPLAIDRDAMLFALANNLFDQLSGYDRRLRGVAETSLP